MNHNRHGRPVHLRPLALLTLGLTVALTWGIAVAQVGPQPNFVTNDVPTYAGAMLKLRVESPVLETFGSGTSATYLIAPAGRFQIQTSPLSPSGGNPTRTGDENRLIASLANVMSTAAWGYEYSSKVTIAIDADPLGQSGVFQDPHAIAVLRGTATDPTGLLDLWPQAPTAGARDVQGVFRVPVDAVTTTSTHTDWLSVRQIQTVIGDIAQIEYIITNQSSQNHRVGLRILIDGTFGGATNLDGSPIVLPDGSVITSETTLPNPQNPSMALPTSWTTYDNPDSPNVVLRGVISGSEVTNPGIATTSADLPTSISWGQMRNIGAANQYYFQPNSAASLLNEDWGYAVTWASKSLAPGESRRYVTYYGMGSSASDYDPPYALMAYAPYTLKAHLGDDPATPGVVESYYLTDDLGRSPFPISAYMDNFGTGPMYDASARLRLPIGLDLQPGQNLTANAGIIQRNEVKSVNWNVFATAARPGKAEIKITGPRGKVVTRSITIPATPVLSPLPDATLGLEMVSIPYEFSDNDAESVFASLGSLFAGGPASVIRWDPQASDYRWFPDPKVTAITPGEGFWLLNRDRETVVLPSDATPVDTTRNYSYDLKAGWNQIGNPFTVSLRMDQVRVAGTNGGDWSLDEAVSRNMLLPTTFAYDPAANQYTWQLTPSQSYLDPFRGYWILARQDLTLIFPPPSSYTPASAKLGVSNVKPTPVSLNNWKLDVQVSTPGLPATMQSAAVRPNATAGLDQYDVPQPPTGLKKNSVYLQSAFYPGETPVGMPYFVDSRAATDGQAEWNLIVKTNATNAPVTVSWPSLESLPSSLIATLVDPVTGERRYMRTTNSYVFKAGTSATERLLKIVVQPRPSVSLALTGVQSAQVGQGGTVLSYALSAEANVDIRIRNISGMVVNEISTGRLTPAGQNSTLWTGRNSRGNLVPNGHYLCEIVARSPITGQSMSVVHPLEVKR